MLVLTRRAGEKVRIGDDITLVVLETKGNRVRIGITAPEHVSVVREEILTLPGRGLASQAKELMHAAGHS
jgi:carbon storage regulator